MTIEEYLNDKNFVIHLHSIARKYDSFFIRRIADRMDFLIEEQYNATRMETMGRGAPS